MECVKCEWLCDGVFDNIGVSCRALLSVGLQSEAEDTMVSLHSVHAAECSPVVQHFVFVLCLPAQVLQSVPEPILFVFFLYLTS